MTDADCISDLPFLTNAQEPLQYHLEQIAGGGIGFYVKKNKTVYLFKKERCYTILSGKTQKLVDRLTYFGSNVSSTENDVNIHLAKRWGMLLTDELIKWNQISSKL